MQEIKKEHPAAGEKGGLAGSSKAESSKKDDGGKEIRKVLIAGRGAVGLTLGKILADHLPEADFAFVCDPERKKRYEKNPVIINGKPVVFQYTDNPEEFGKADLILFFTKYGALPAAMEEAAPFMDEDTILMCGTNGILSETDLRRRFPDSITLRTIAQKMDAVYHDNQLTFENAGELVFGQDEKGQEQAAAAVQNLFDACGFPYILSQDIVKDQYSKLTANCGINQVCAAFGLNYGDVAENPRWNAMYREAMEETRAVLNAHGANLGEDVVLGWIEAEKGFAKDGMPSMAQDVKAGRKTELELFSGTVLPMAEEKDVAVPVLKDLYERIAKLDEQNASKKAV